MSVAIERDYWAKLLGQYVRLTKDINGYSRAYTGVIKDVLDDKLVVEDRYLGNTPLTFSGLSLIGKGKYKVVEGVKECRDRIRNQKEVQQ